MGIRVTPIDPTPRLMEYYGIRLWVKYQGSVQAIRAKRLELVAEAGLTEEEYDKQPEEYKQRMFGRSFIGTVVTDIEDFEVEDADGNTIQFRFNDPSEMDEYETMGEELLGEDELLRDEVLTHCVTIEHFREEREVRELKNSKKRSGSGGKSETVT